MPQLQFDFSTLDTDRLFAIAKRAVSHETVTSAEAFAALITKAADVAVKAGLYIITGEQSRDFRDRATVNQVIAEYDAEA